MYTFFVCFYKFNSFRHMFNVTVEKLVTRQKSKTENIFFNKNVFDQNQKHLQVFQAFCLLKNTKEKSGLTQNFNFLFCFSRFAWTLRNVHKKAIKAKLRSPEHPSVDIRAWTYQFSQKLKQHSGSWSTWNILESISCINSSYKTHFSSAFKLGLLFMAHHIDSPVYVSRLVFLYCLCYLAGQKTFKNIWCEAFL